MDDFLVIQVPSDAARVTEVMGTKRKFWFCDPQLCTCLFKLARPETGEDWAEKIAAELCAALNLPHAKQELGIWQGRRGTVSPAMLLPDEDLIHGNDVLAGMVSSYPREAIYNVSQHTLDVVLQAIGRPNTQIPLNWTSPHPSIDNAVHTFVGYLLLDAWIGNGDRHHENWGLVSTSDRTIHLAPTYDHASSLGRELSDEKRRVRLQNQSIGAYLKKNHSAFYERSSDPKPLTTLAVFQSAATSHPQAARAWLTQLSDISSEWVENLLARVPEDRMSSTAKKFAAAILEFNKTRLLALQEELP
jgi:HipA-like C-terminal domain